MKRVLKVTANENFTFRIDIYIYIYDLRGRLGIKSPTSNIYLVLVKTWPAVVMYFMSSSLRRLSVDHHGDLGCVRVPSQTPLRRREEEEEIDGPSRG